ncbi:MAG TPA: SDR family oxidoreductase, partial [Vicinamibacterales bacterium]|nr:SDR family oxidoreductase [Vicinamibacterales bacterium]
HPRMRVTIADVRDTDAIDVSGVEAIFHLAGIANDPAADLNPSSSWEVNVLSTMRLADRAARAGVRQFVFPSSGAVYGVRNELRITEDLDLMPISNYNKTKMVAERVLLSYADRMAVSIFRPATVCGLSPRMRLDLTVNGLTMQALTKQKMTVFGGAQVRPNIHIDDLVDLYLFALHTRLAGVYNAAYENLTVREIACAIASAIPAEIVTTPSDDPRSYRLCSDRLASAGFTPKRRIGDAVAELASAYRDGRLVDRPNCYTVRWMKEQRLG